MRKAALAAIGAFLLFAVSASSADTFAVNVVSQDATTITLGWSPQPGYGYLFSANGTLVSRTNDPNRSSVKFSKNSANSYDVDVITKGANGHCCNIEQPPPPKNQCEDGIDNDGDGKTDYPADPGCANPTDNDETNAATPSAFPDASNTGVPPGTQLTAYTGPLNITAPNTVIDGKTIGCIDISATGVVIRNSRVSCSINTDFYAVQVRSGTVLIEDSEVSCLNTNANGINGRGITVRRTDVSGCENGLDFDGSSLAEDNWVHDLVTANGAHTDGVQINQGVCDVTLRHNTIDPVPGTAWLATSAIIMWDEGPPQNCNVLIENNRLLGEGASFPIYTPRQGPLTNVRVINNRLQIGVGGYNGGNGSLLTDGSGNVDDSTGRPISLG